MKTQYGKEKSNLSGSVVSPMKAIEEALRIGNFSLVRKLCKGLLQNPEQASMRPQALNVLDRISIDNVVICIGCGVFALFSLLSIFFMLK